MTIPYYKMAVSQQVFEDILSGKNTNTIRAGKRHLVSGVSDKSFIFQEVDGSQQPTGRNLKVTLENVSHKTVAELSEQDIAANGITQANAREVMGRAIQKKLDEVEAAHPPHSIEGLEAWSEVLDNENSWRYQQMDKGYNDQQIAMLMDMKQYYPDLDWNSQVSVASFSEPKEISVEQAAEIVKENKDVHECSQVWSQIGQRTGRG